MRAGVAALPTGTVTLLFSDIEGSTRLLEALGDAYADLLSDHHRLLRSVWAQHRGVEVSTDGDSFFVAFADAQDAVDAACEAQHALRTHAWPAGARVRVRMGLHTGRPRLAPSEDDYWGIDVHFAARVAAAAHGGQVLLSGPAADLVSAPVEDLGEWRLKDFDAPERLFQLVVDGEGADAFPSPRAMDVLRTNLPRPATEILGRETELAAVSRLLLGSSTQLVTIVGPGGSGKTRLALELGHTLLEHFTDGVFWVDLSGVTEPAAIPRAVADAIAAPDRPDAPPAIGVRDHLRGRRLLLVIDNCEHLIAGVGVIASWLQSASELRVLATSELPLRLRAERCVPLGNLEPPSPNADDVEDLPAIPSARATAERANPASELDARSAAAMAERSTGWQSDLSLLERESELGTLSTLVARLSSAREGGAALVEGPPGIGKSAVLAAAVAAAGADERLEVRTARGSELDVDLAFGSVRELLGPAVFALDEAGQRDVLSGPAAHARPVLGLGQGGSPLDDPRYALFWLVANLADRRPLVLALDDVQWLDDDSARFIAYLARRIEGLPVLLLAAGRPREPGGDSVVMDVLAETGIVLRPGPLSADATATLLGDEPRSADALRVTGGNPFLLVELGYVLEQAPEPLVVDELASEPVARWVTRRVARISPTASALASAVALFPAGGTLAEAAHVAELDEAAATVAADALIAANVLTVAGTRLEFLHPLMRSSLYEELGVFARRRGHARAAAMLRQRGAAAEQVAAHLLAGEPAGDLDSVHVLRAAAEQAVAASAPRAAVRYLERALAEGAATDDLLLDLLLDLGRLQRQTQHAGAQATLESAFAHSAGTSRHAEAAIELMATALVNGDSARAVAVATGMANAEASADERLTLNMLHAEVAWLQRDIATCLRLIGEVPPHLPGDTNAQRTALAMAASVSLLRCDRPRDEVLDMLRRATGDNGTGELVSGVDISDLLGYLIFAEALDEAQALSTGRLELARETGDEAMFNAEQRALGWILSLRGDLLGSEAAYRIALAQPGMGGFRRAHMSLALTETLFMRGDLDAAQSELDSITPGAFGAAIETWRTSRLAILKTRRGEHEAALPAFEERLADEQRIGQVHPNMCTWMPDYAGCLAGLGRRDEAIALMEDLVERSDAVGAVWGAGLHRIALGRLTGDMAHLEGALAVLEPSPYRWHEAWARLELGAALRRRGQRIDAREHLRLALDYSERQRVLHFGARAREELKLTGARPRSGLVAGADALTPAEARVARLAAEGLSNKQIAQDLFLTVKTVENTLSRAFRKLDISSRRELPGALELAA